MYIVLKIKCICNILPKCGSVVVFLKHPESSVRIEEVSKIIKTHNCMKYIIQFSKMDLQIDIHWSMRWKKIFYTVKE